MPNEVDLSLRRIRNSRNLDGSNFLDLYVRLMTAQEMDDVEYSDILRFGIFMSRSSDDGVRRLGYRIFLQYGESQRDYEPLRSVAVARDLIPLVEAIDRIYPETASDTDLTDAFFAAHASNFLELQGGREIYRTRGQMELRSFNAREDDALVIAPTSYGKSEMLIDKVSSDLQQRTCVLVPSRALIAQTRTSIVSDLRVRSSRVRVITHPDAYNGEDHFVAVMTQERLQRLLLDHPDVALDQLLIDEAQNLLAGDSRAVELSQVILISRARNLDLSVTYYTPFVASPENLRHIEGVDRATRSKTVNEHVKVEKFVIAEPGTHHRLYDQFLNESFELDSVVPSDELGALIDAGGHRVLVYVNRPADAQALASRLASRRESVELSPVSMRAIQAIADLIDPRYSLIDAIKRGVMFHHGQVPDSLRLYIEELFRDDDSSEARYLVTTSTLLEGVNTPADRLVMMSGSKGRGNLSPAAFRNLVGRVGRFREVFARDRADLALLQPRIYLIPSSYARRNWNVDGFLASVANVARAVEDKVENPLLESAGDSAKRHAALEFLENVEPGATTVVGARRAQTAVGQLCFRHGVRDFDIIAVEGTLQERVESRADEEPLDDVSELLDAIVEIFFEEIELPEGDDLARIRDTSGARRFYAMFLDWRSRNEPFRRMIAHFVRYWSNLDDEYVFVGHRWGEVSFGGPRKLFVQMGSKTRTQLVNLAVVKIKEEQDFVDFRLLKYIEVLFSLEMISESLYFRIKYGTDEPFLICLLRNGFSPELARLVGDEYREHVMVDFHLNQVAVHPQLPVAMRRDEQNDILAYEAQTLVNVGLEVD
ncbi:hypothetical protein JF550_14160 [Microbacterium esteraromaticum]|uniref:Helicase C-terminal domain-containing protein n=1 Tax=Microbacterium esteraromaticum TaxID=57043 RepID=A0A939DZJ1_9MICO|nr:helicase-related protein [Microbacterium esteraromaticum]MBN8207092.1 hypothetical protein [Microbacterium esteraromaticum]MBN8417246.1 hypothetical protein [Microbacterium esteraromaticum]